MHVPRMGQRFAALAVAVALCTAAGFSPATARASTASASCEPSATLAADRLDRSAVRHRRAARRLARRAKSERRAGHRAHARRLRRAARRHARLANHRGRDAAACYAAAGKGGTIGPTRPAVDSTAPTVAFKQPTAGATLSGSIGGTACEATASDSTGVARVEFSVDGTALNVEREVPYNCSFDTSTVSDGAHTLEARAVDAAGNTASAHVAVSVKNAADPVPEPEPEPAPSPILAPLPAPIGVEGGIRYRSGTDLVNTISRLRASGIAYTREAIAWKKVEPTRGNWTWTETDRWVGEAARQGLRVVAILHQPPEWATGSADHHVAPVEGQPLADYARYVRAAVERYGSNGSFWAQNPSIPKVPITRWDIWNEPYMSMFWHNTGAHAFPDPAGYARMFKAAVVEGRKAGDPAARFMAEGEIEAATTDWSNPRYFLSRMFEAVPDLAQYMDILSIHPYVGTNPARSPSQCTVESTDVSNRFNFCRVKTFRRILDRYGATATRMWITEIGWSTCPTCSKWKVSEDTQALYVRDVFRLLREWKLVDGLIWWVYKTPEKDPAHAEDWMGLVRADGSAKPAWYSFADELGLGL
jgi:hypothetical protein